MTTLDPELRERLRLACKLGKDEMNRRHAVNHFDNVEKVVTMMDGLSDDDAEQFLERMLDDAEPVVRPVVSNFVDAIRAARSASRQ
jgi:hypothetical protein